MLDSDEIRQKWVDIFFELDMTPTEACELKSAVNGAWYRVPNAVFDEWIAAAVGVLYRTYGLVPMQRLNLFAQAFYGEGAVVLSGERTPHFAARLRDALDRLVATNRLVRHPSELYEPPSLLDTLART